MKEKSRGAAKAESLWQGREFRELELRLLMAQADRLRDEPQSTVTRITNLEEEMRRENP